MPAWNALHSSLVTQRLLPTFRQHLKRANLFIYVLFYSFIIIFLFIVVRVFMCICSVLIHYPGLTTYSHSLLPSHMPVLTVHCRIICTVLETNATLQSSLKNSSIQGINYFCLKRLNTSANSGPSKNRQLKRKSLKIMTHLDLNV